MQILGEEEVGEFCAAEAERRDDLLAAQTAQKRRPAYLLPWFELCNYVHSRARLKRLDVGAFRRCWSALVSGHFENSGDGFLVHLDDGAMDADELLKTVYALRRPPPREQNRRGDARDRNHDWKEEVLRGRLRDLQERAVLELNARVIHEIGWHWDCTPPDELPERKHLAHIDFIDTVLDTNVLVELLNELPVPEQPGTPLSKLAEPIRVRLLPALSGGFGKLIVPITVLIETEGVIAANVGDYQRADKELRRMAAQPHHSRYAAFAFESMNIETFVAFLHLIERLVEANVPRDWWPPLGDALVLAHGISNGCPVASYEWLHKDEWRRTQLHEAFPYLELR